MRLLSYREMRQRGCEFCLDYRRARPTQDEKYCKLCLHDACPYHELDEVKSYGAYLKTKQKEKLLTEYIRKLFEL